ncbi:MAG: T9SS type A sorting domain-containing protein [Bacteroidia bacterium]
MRKFDQPLVFLFLCLNILSVPLLRAQCLTSAYNQLDINQVNARFDDGGSMFWDRVSASRYYVPKNSGKISTFAAGLWVGGLDSQGQLHVAAANYEQTGTDYYTGPMRQPISYDCPVHFSASTEIFRNGLIRLANGDVLVVDSNQVTIYDPVTLQTLVRPFAAPRGWVGAYELADGRILLYGDDNYPNKNPIMYMDTVSYSFISGPTLTWFHKESSATQLDNGKVLIAGVVGCEVLDVTNNTTTAVPDMLYPRQRHATVKRPNGDVITFGGGQSLGGTGYTLRTQIFDDTLGYWFPGPDLAVARNAPTTVRRANGTYLIIGGTTLDSLVEIYDPVSNTVSPGPYLINPAGDCNATSLSNGDIVVVAKFTAWMTNFINLYRQSSNTFVPIRKFRLGTNCVLLNGDTVLVAQAGGRGFRRMRAVGDFMYDDKWRQVWRVSKAEIDEFRADFLANTVDFSHYPDIEVWPAHGDELLGEDRNLAPFIDVDMDGRYDPSGDGDYPCIVGDQALWWVFNDQGLHGQTQGQPLGIQVEAMAYAFDCGQTTCPDTSVDYTTFLHYEITNKSSNTYQDLRMGAYFDTDLGNYYDDYIGSDSTLQLGYAYNGDVTDDLPAGYGLQPPAFGVSILPNAQPTGRFSMMYYQNNFSVVGVPNAPDDYYDYLNSTWIDGQHLVNNGANGHPGTGSGAPVSAMYPSSDGFCGGQLAGWSEAAIGNTPSDRSLLVGSHGYSLQPGERIQFDLAMPWVRGTDNLNSVCGLKAATANIIPWWQNQVDRSCFDMLVGTDKPLAKIDGLRLIPNPNSGSGLIVDRGQPVVDVGTLEVWDMQGRRVMEQDLAVGTSQVRLETGSLTPGIYLVRWMDGSGVWVERMVRQ